MRYTSVYSIVPHPNVPVELLAAPAEAASSRAGLGAASQLQRLVRPARALFTAGSTGRSCYGRGCREAHVGRTLAVGRGERLPLVPLRWPLVTTGRPYASRRMSATP